MTSVHITSRPIIRLSFAAILSMLMASCGESKVSQCNKITTIANETVGEVQGVVQANSIPNNEAFLKVADSFDRGRTEMERVRVADQQLKEYQQQFIAMYSEVGRSARELANAMGQQDFDAAREAHSAFQTATGQEEPLVNAVNEYCGAIVTSQ